MNNCQKPLRRGEGEAKKMSRIVASEKLAAILFERERERGGERERQTETETETETERLRERQTERERQSACQEGLVEH